MTGSSALLAILLFVAFTLRVVLDIASLKEPKPGFDMAYAILFLVVGVVAVIDDASSIWGYAFLGTAGWSLVSFFVKRSPKKEFHGEENT